MRVLPTIGANANNGVAANRDQPQFSDRYSIHSRGVICFLLRQRKSAKVGWIPNDPVPGSTHYGHVRVSFTELLNPPAENGNLPPGTLLNNGKYRIGNVLGQGGFGITYEAHDVRLDRAVAIKEFFPTQLAHRSSGSPSLRPHSDRHSALFSDGLTGFIEEARILHDLNHPNVVNVRDYLEENGTGYIVMSYYEGQTLASAIQEAGGKLPWEKALTVMRGVLDGLDAAHASGVVHRDVKPQNIYITNKGRAVLLDFGAARYALGEQTHTHTTILTRGFAPLEQYDASKGSQGPWTDVYAAAATLYFAISGVEPPEAIGRLDNDALKPLTSFDKSVPGRTNFAIATGLAVHRRDRPQTVEAFRELLFTSRKFPGAWKFAIAAVLAIGAISVGSLLAKRPKSAASTAAALGLGEAVKTSTRGNIRVSEPTARTSGRVVSSTPQTAVLPKEAKRVAPDPKGSEAAPPSPPQTSNEPSSRDLSKVIGPMNSGITQATVFAEYGAAQEKYKAAMTELRALLQRYPKSERLPALKDSLDNLVARAR